MHDKAFQLQYVYRGIQPWGRRQFLKNEIDAES